MNYKVDIFFIKLMNISSITKGKILYLWELFNGVIFLLLKKISPIYFTHFLNFNLLTL